MFCNYYIYYKCVSDMRICLLGLVDECNIWTDNGSGIKPSHDTALQKDTSI